MNDIEDQYYCIVDHWPDSILLDIGIIVIEWRYYWWNDLIIGQLLTMPIIDLILQSPHDWLRKWLVSERARED